MASDRYPALKPDELTPEQKDAYEYSANIAKDMFGDKFIWQDKDGSMLGPFGPMLYTPSLIEPFLKLVTEMGKYKSLPAAARETAILATGSTYEAGYELYAHGRIAEATSLSETQIALIKKGEKPTGSDKLDEGCDVAFDAALELTRTKGPLSNEVFRRAVAAFGREGTAILIHYIGSYAYTCVLLNGVAAPVPE